MMMGMSMSIRQKIEIRQRLTVAQKFTLRISLIQSLRDCIYRIEEKCPFCDRTIKAEDILKGFNRDPDDFTTVCPECEKRFEPKLYFSDMFGKAEIQFYCPEQVKARLGELKGLSPAKMQKQNPSIYHSVLIHWGSLRKAFKEIGIDYQFKEINEWKRKVIPFLGEMPDNLIADCVGVSPTTIRNWRIKKDIPAFIKKEEY